MQGRGHADGGSAEAQNERQGVQQPPEATPECTLGGGQDGGDVDDLVQPGRSRGKCWYSGNTLVRIDDY